MIKKYAPPRKCEILVRLIKKGNELVQFYSDIAKLVLGILLSGGVTLGIKWYGDRKTARDSAHQDAISIHDTMLNCRNDMNRVQDFVKGVEVVVESVCCRFDTGRPITQDDIDAMRNELKKRPDIGRQ